MKSLRDLRNELVGVRLFATNVSLWSQAGPVEEAARTAINDAIRTYEFTIQRVYNSVVLPDSGEMIAVLPRDVRRIVEIWATSNTGGGYRNMLRGGYDYRPTQETNFLYLHAHVHPGVKNLQVLYESRLTEAPREAVVGQMFTSGAKALAVSGGVPSAEWRAPGYLGVLPGGSSRTTTQFELIRYEAVTPTTFTGLSRDIGGQLGVSGQTWSLGDIVTPMIEVPDQALPVLIHAAQAEMYHFWVRSRALYEEYTGIASLQQMDLGDLLGLIRTEEDRADRRFRRAKQAPAPTHVNVKRRRR